MIALRLVAVLGALVLFAAVANAALAEETELNTAIDLEDAVEPRNPALAAAIRIIGAAVRWAAKRCLKEAAMHCKQHWKNPKALANCGKSYLQANRGRCVVG